MYICIHYRRCMYMLVLKRLALLGGQCSSNSRHFSNIFGEPTGLPVHRP